MEVRIRMQKAGKSANKQYNYRIVAMSRTSSRQTRHLDLIGYYDAGKNPAVVYFDQAKLDHWLNRGASMSETVKSLVKRHGKG
jgi:small subunit ribosomal protein S16